MSEQDELYKIFEKHLSLDFPHYPRALEHDVLEWHKKYQQKILSHWEVEEASIRFFDVPLKEVREMIGYCKSINWKPKV